jgi:hypothetical protein
MLKHFVMRIKCDVSTQLVWNSVSLVL